MAGGGLTRYHAHGLIVPLIIAVSPVVWNRIPLPFPRAMNALLWGALVGAGVYLVFSFVPLLGERQAMAKAVVLGLLVAEKLVVSGKTSMPGASGIALFMYLYVHAAEALDSPH